ncbi:MAG TPA: MmcQ/YjbR family DNA-binding protein [Dermatophilaceae bacterium]|nr:MmcQ/YjbR family DNA-binding protein [Dermatophilaceae bacterium]
MSRPGSDRGTGDIAGRLDRRRLLEYCLAKPGAWQDEPWEHDIVAKVGDKIFAFLGSEEQAAPVRLGIKAGASRAEADEWLQQYPQDASVMAYLGRAGWNTLRVGGAIPDEEILDAVDASYEAVVARLPKSRRPG